MDNDSHAKVKLEYPDGRILARSGWTEANTTILTSDWAPHIHQLESAVLSPELPAASSHAT